MRARVLLLGMILPLAALSGAEAQSEGSFSSQMTISGGPQPTPKPPSSLSGAAASAPKASSDAVGSETPSGPHPPISDQRPPQPATSPSAAAIGSTYMFRVCNRSSLDAAVADVHQTPGGGGWTVEGWSRVSAGECSDLGRLPHGWVYFYAESSRGAWNGTMIEKCVAYPGPFQRHENGGSYTCRRNEELKGFDGSVVETNYATFTWTLNP